jgi:epoxyqueuosine reductase
VIDYSILTTEILSHAPKFGFLEANIAHIKIDDTTQSNFLDWLQQKFNGEMEYLAKNTNLRFNPQYIFNNTVSIICVKVPYLTNTIKYHQNRALNQNIANISAYALGRDYHKVVKQRLNEYAKLINQIISEYNLELNYRAFTDSAPVLEVELALSAGLGWRGKNTLLLNKNHGSTFFLGELFTNLPLIPGTKTDNHCGSCSKCLDICPTRAFTAPYVLDARACISYLTIENKGSIPIEYRHAIGNRIYGCDDCQLVCPWNKFSRLSRIEDFTIRHNLDKLSLIEVFGWDEATWVTKMQGSSIFRIGYISWLRNIAVALGNAPTSTEIVEALNKRLDYPSALVQEHVKWALEQHKIC